MLELEDKYVFHIPMHKFENERVTRINMEKVIDDLIRILNESGYDSFYSTKVTGHYKDRSFDEVLITVFSSSSSNRHSPDVLFSKWFKDNNGELRQEAFAYEYNNRVYIEKLE